MDKIPTNAKLSETDLTNTNPRNYWQNVMREKQNTFYNKINKVEGHSFDNILILDLEKFSTQCSLTSPIIDPRDILCFVEKCVDERFIYNRRVPRKALQYPNIKYSYRQMVVDFGVPGVGCLYNEVQSKNVANKIVNFLQKNNIPIYLSEGHEQCGAIAAKLRKVNSREGFAFSPTSDEVLQAATTESQHTSKLIKSIAKSNFYDLKVFRKTARLTQSVYRNEDDKGVNLATIHNGVGLVFLPNFLDKPSKSKVFEPDKFCLSHDVCLFNMIDTGRDLDNCDNSTAEYIVFCLNIMIGANGLGLDFFKETPLIIMAACDKTIPTDLLRSHQIVQQIKDILKDKQELIDCLKFVFIEY